MTSDELRAAADRLRRDAASDRPGYFSPVYLGSTHNPDDDAYTLARAWLAEHPADDGEPVTPEWVESIGFIKTHPFAWRRCPLHFFHDSLATILSIEDARWAQGNPTRGDVRRLLAALGITPGG